MKKFNIGKVLGVVVLGVVFWTLMGFNDIDGEKGNLSIDNEPIVDYDNITDKKNYITSMDDFYAEIKKEDERLKQEEHKKRMEMIEQERIKRAQELERQRLAKIEAEKKKEQELHNKQKQVNDKSNVNTSGWTTYHATYYSPYCSGCSGKTALSINVRSSIYYQGMRIIAVDPSVIPLWSIVEVSTPYETFTALAGDTGGAIKGRKIDILVSTKNEAYSKGRHDVKVKVIRYGK